MNGDDRKAPKLKLIVNTDRELFAAIADNDPHRVTASLARSPNGCWTAAPTSGHGT